MPAIRLEHVAKSYKDGNYETVAIRNIDLTVEQGEFVFLVGSRGAGKSTLLDIITGSLKPDRGAVYLDDVDVTRLGRRQSEQVRSCIGQIGRHDTLDRMGTVYDNLSTVRKVGFFWTKKELNQTLADKALGIVGMPDSGGAYPRDLSPSEFRRVQVAKAILRSPAILIMDDFPGNMDEDTVWDMLHLLMELNRRGTTLLLATNSSYVVNVMRRRVVTLADGRIVGDVQKGRYGYIG